MKSDAEQYRISQKMSLPSRERGLKYHITGELDRKIYVAPFAGAWIEILRMKTYYPTFESLPSRERGLKYMKGVCNIYLNERRSLRGSVD